MCAQTSIHTHTQIYILISLVPKGIFYLVGELNSSSAVMSDARERRNIWHL